MLIIGVIGNIPNTAAGGSCFMHFSDSPKIQCNQGGMAINS